MLQRPLSPGNSESLTATANYSKAVHQVLDVVHEVLHHQRRLDSIWQHRKVRLHQRLQLCVFQQDVQQVTGPASGIHARQADGWAPGLSAQAGERLTYGGKRAGPPLAKNAVCTC